MSAHYLRMKMVKVMDTQGWGQPVEVARILIPSDWKAEGGANWVSGMTRCPANIIQVNWRAVSPDGLTGFEIFPTYAWSWSDDPLLQQSIQSNAANNMGCDARPPMRAGDFLTAMVIPARRRGARVLRTEPLPSVTQAEQETLSKNYAQMIQGGYMRSVHADAARVRLEYSVNGQPVEEWLSANTSVLAAPMASSAGLMNGNMNQSANSFQNSAYNIIAVHAPKGALDGNAKLYAMMVASIRPNPQYQAAVGAWLRNMGRIQQQGAMDRHKIWQDAQAYIANSIQQTYAENQRVQNKQAEQFGQLMRGVETYIDPRSNERVELTAGWNSAWSNGKGEYILVDSPNIDPAKLLQEDWREMSRPPR
ncbi:MAG TPA: hypothetical protein VG817_10455 [Gemmatimonadales bacterium]|nr:hypothetical protein [Gemmatimonadales bacterium]